MKYPKPEHMLYFHVTPDEAETPAPRAAHDHCTDDLDWLGKDEGLCCIMMMALCMRVIICAEAGDASRVW